MDQDPLQADRPLPYSEQAEHGVLGCILLEPKIGMGFCVEKIKRGSEIFYDGRHQALYEVLLEMYDNQEHIDPITLQQKLQDSRQLEHLGGMPWIVGLMNAVPSAASLEYYLEIVREKFVLRKLIQTCTATVSRIYEHEGGVDDLLAGVSKEMQEVAEEQVCVGEKKVKELVHVALNTIEDLHQRQGKIMGLPTGFRDFDKMTSGLRGGDMIVIAARPSRGKSSWGMNVAEHVSIEVKEPVGVFSLEMTAESLVMRTLCSRARVNLRNIQDGILTEGDFPKLSVAAAKIANAPLYIDDSSDMTVTQLRAKARRMHQQYGIKLFIIDYLQFLRGSTKRVENRQQEVSQISNGLKSLAKELNVPVIVLAQLNRELEKDKKRKPRLSDLRESGSIEQDADLVGFLYDPDAEKKDDESEKPAEDVAVNLLIAKQRNGPTGDVRLLFRKGITRFESLSPVQD
jgi:replicative DNA helicase